MKFKVFILSLFLVPYTLFAQGTSLRTGFVDGPVWFSDESLVLGETTKIYTAIFNGEDTKLSVKVDFIDDTIVLGTKDITLNSNETRGISIDWKITTGSHKIFARIASATVNGKTVLLDRDVTDAISFSVTKEIPGSVVKNALMAKFSTILEGEGTFTQKADSWFKLNFKKSEEFREQTLKKIENSKKVVEKRRLEEKNKKTSEKIIPAIHFYALIVAKFIFSVSIVFYLCAIALAYLVLCTLWRILKRIFRKKHEE